MDEQLRRILNRIQALKDHVILLEVDVQALLIAREDAANGGGCPHAKAVDVTTNGGGPRRALCPECGETITLAEQPAQQEG